MRRFLVFIVAAILTMALSASALAACGCGRGGGKLHPGPINDIVCKA
ncbi:MAG: hypothetical protein V2B18_01505 [Pseudomonadota bacterium]